MRVCLPVVYGFANVSGANLNPAVSFALMCTGHMTWWKTLAYMCMQVSCGQQAAGSMR
jgi:glycerol uptake facilitator-like aquaporin